MLEDIILDLIKKDGSDIHLSVGKKPAIRVDGDLLFLVNSKPLSKKEIEDIVKEMVNEDAFKKLNEEKELDFSYSFKEDVRLRGNAFFQLGEIAISLRLIPKSKTMSELRLPPILETFARKRQGFFLVVGPVGQGKSTTMSAMINLINKERAAHIITIEDPIEYIYNPERSIISQREVGVDTQDFDRALKSAFREDVNVIMVGEMRSSETMKMAVTAAETGHLVISTLHTNNASQTIARIIDSFPSAQQDQIRTQLASSLIGVFSQRLIPRIQGGRIPAYELMINNNAVTNLIRENRIHEIDLVMETGYQQGMIDMNRSLLELVQKGEITMENALNYSFNPRSLEQLM